MKLSDKELTNITEGCLLSLVVTEMRIASPGIDPHKAIASALGCSVQNVRNWEAEKGHPGLTNWLKIAEVTRSTLIKQWILLHLK